MKRLLTLLAILVTLNAYSQNTTTLPTGTNPSNISARTKGTDSLHTSWFNFPDIGWNQYYSATEANLRFENKANKTNIISSSTTQYTTPKAVQDYTYAKAHIDSTINNAVTQNYDFSALTTGTATITNTSLIGMYVYSVIRSGAEYDIITSGTPSGNSALFNGTTGAITFADNFNTAQAEKGHVRYKSIIGASPTAPTGLQILYADSYATAATFATGTGNKLIYVKNDEVNGGTNADGSFASSIYQYSNNVLQFYLRTTN